MYSAFFLSLLNENLSNMESSQRPRTVTRLTLAGTWRGGEVWTFSNIMNMLLFTSMFQICYVVNHLVEIRYRVVFLTGPPNFQYQKEKRCSTNEDLLYIENFLEQNL